MPENFREDRLPIRGCAHSLTSTTAHANLPGEGSNATKGSPQQLNDDLLLSRWEVQTFFGLTKRFLEVSAVRGDGPPMVRIGRAVKYRTGDLRAWIEARRVNSTSQVVSK